MPNQDVYLIAQQTKTTIEHASLRNFMEGVRAALTYETVFPGESGPKHPDILYAGEEGQKRQREVLAKIQAHIDDVIMLALREQL